MTTSRRHFLSFAAACMAVGVPRFARAGVASDTAAQINALRRSSGRPLLAADRVAASEAARHARRMADARRTFQHPDLGSVPAEKNWDRAQQIVGMGTSPQDLVRRASSDAYMRSHLLGEYDALSVGVVQSANGDLYLAAFLFHTAACAR